MKSLAHHYALLLGLESPWKVESVDLQVEEKRVEIGLEHSGGKVTCPECGASCSLADHAVERTWRHLDTMQFETLLAARVPRSRCTGCGVKTVAVPWAGKHGRFTLMFEAFAIEVIKACSNVRRAAELLRLDWSAVQTIMKRAVERGMQRRDLEGVRQVGIDEKSFKRGQSYVSTLTDLRGGRVLEVVNGRKKTDADGLWDVFTKKQTQELEAVALDMWPAFINSALEQAPNADLVHDRFHIVKHLNEALDQVRRAEQKRIKPLGDERLSGTRMLWLRNPLKMSRKQKRLFGAVRNSELKTARGWAIKEALNPFWMYIYSGAAENYFNRWYSWASRSRLKPIVKVAKMIKRHLKHILTWCAHRITNAVTEGLNSKIQSLKSAARGFRSFANYRIRIMFFCAKLDLFPLDSCHENP